jgi:hypothetical protein
MTKTRAVQDKQDKESVGSFNIFPMFPSIHQQNRCMIRIMWLKHADGQGVLLHKNVPDEPDNTVRLQRLLKFWKININLEMMHMHKHALQMFLSKGTSCLDLALGYLQAI